jgi:L-fuculose-phosphate aldolase
MILAQFQSIGQDLVARGLVSSHGGNLSMRMGDKMIITRRGCMLGSIRDSDLIETGVCKNDRNTPMASVELAVHRAIYQNTAAQAVVHAHPPYAITLSMLDNEVLPACVECASVLDRIPVVGWNMEVKPGALAEPIAHSLKDNKVVLVKGHGSFAVGQLLEEAHKYTTALEENCHIAYLLKSLQSSNVKS